MLFRSEQEIADLETEKNAIEEALCSGTLSVDELTAVSYTHLDVYKRQILVRTPGHMFVGYYTDSSHKDMNFLETTMIGDVEMCIRDRSSVM